MVSKESNDLLRKLFQRFYSLSGWLWGLWNPSKFYFGCSWRRKLAKPIPVVRFPGKDIIFLLPQLIPLRDRVTDAAFDFKNGIDVFLSHDLPTSKFSGRIKGITSDIVDPEGRWVKIGRAHV